MRRVYIDLRVLEPWRSDAVFADELHEQHVVAQHARPWAAYTTLPQAIEVTVLLLSPRLHHLTRIVLRVAAFEAMISGDISVLRVGNKTHPRCRQTNSSGTKTFGLETDVVFRR